jgi:hypothetical protein
VQCRFFRGAPAGAFGPCDSPYWVDVSRLGQATYTLEAQVVDRAGNTSETASTSYRYDMTPPPAPAFTTRPPARGTSGTATWTFAVPVGATAVCVVTHEGSVEEQACNSGSFNLRVGTPGTWSLSVRFVDEAGNVGASTVGSYTLTTAAFVRDRVDGGTPGAGPTRPRGDTSGPDEPGVATPGSAPFIGPPARSPLGAVPRATEAVKNVVKRAGSVFQNRPPGIQPDIRVPDAIKNVIGKTITKPQLPLALFVIVVLFLLVQNRIDRRDPKLAAAPVAAEPDLEFGPRVRFVATGGATA